MAIEIGQILLSTTVNTLFGQYFSLLFGSSETQAEREERIRRSFTEFLGLLSREFQSNTEQAIRAALLDHSFEEIRTDSTTAISLFTQYAYTINRERPQGEVSSLDSASASIERALSRLQLICDRMCEEPLPVIDWTKPLADPNAPKIVTTMRSKMAVLVKSLQTVASVRFLILAKRAEIHPGLQNAIVRDIAPAIIATVNRLDARQRQILPLRFNCCIQKEGVTATNLANRPLTFANIESIGRQIYPKSPETDEQMVILECTYDQTEKFKALARCRISNFTFVWAFRRYGKLPANWHGALFVPPTQDRDAALPSEAAHENSIMVPFALENHPHFMGLPLIGLSNEIMRMAVAKLTSQYEATEYPNLRIIRDLAERVSAQMANNSQ